MLGEGRYETEAGKERGSGSNGGQKGTEDAPRDGVTALGASQSSTRLNYCFVSFLLARALTSAAGLGFQKSGS